MKNKQDFRVRKGRRLLAGFAVMIAAITLAGCDTGAGGNPNPVVTGVTVSPGAAAVVRGGTAAFTAAVSGTGSPAQTVTWAVSGGERERPLPRRAC
jgi:hypothetical protein